MANHSAPRNDIRKLPAFLKAQGYEVVAFGKVGHYEQTKNYGFDHWEHTTYHDDVAVPAAIEWLQKRDSKKPLAFFVGTNWPHVPWPVKDPTYNMSKLALPPTQVDTSTTRRARARYYTAVDKMDKELGEVYDLTRQKLGPNTLFLTTSDHGSQFPFGKWNLYDAGIQTSMIAVWQGVVPGGKRTQAMVSWIDVLPTIVEASGGVASTEWDGKSFLSVLQGKQTKFRDAIYASHSGDGKMNRYPSRTVRTVRWKYIRNLDPSLTFTSHVDRAAPGAGQVNYWKSWEESTSLADRATVERYHHRPAEELYDLEKDPFEMINLATEPRYSRTLAEMRQKLNAWMRSTGDKGLGSEPEDKSKNLELD